MKDNLKNKGTVLNLSKNKLEISQEGFNKLQTRLDKLVTTIRPSVMKELVEARSQGDLSENADYEAAKNKQAMVESEISEIQDHLSRAKIIKKAKIDQVSINNIVTYKRLDNNEIVTIKLVGITEIDPGNKIPFVSKESPVGSALITRKKGEEVKINVSNPYRIIIQKIK